MKSNSLLLIFFLVSIPSFACQCPTRAWQWSVKIAYDVVVGEVIGEKELPSECGQHSNSYEYTLKVTFSYQNKVADTIIVHGGKGRGDCGTTFYKGRDYLIFLHECERQFFTLMCDDNSWLPYADRQITFLNDYHKKNYQPGPSWGIINVLAINSFPAFIAMLLSWNAFTHRRINIKFRSKRKDFFDIQLIVILFACAWTFIWCLLEFAHFFLADMISEPKTF